MSVADPAQNPAGGESRAAPAAAPDESTVEGGAARPAAAGGPASTGIDRYWPAPGRIAPPRAVATILAAGVAGGVVLDLGSPGLGWPLAGLAIAAVALLSGRATGASSRRARVWRPERLLWGMASLALLSVAALRADAWIIGYCLVAALATGSVALAGGRTLKGLFFGAVLGVAAAVRALPWVVRGTAALRVTRPGGARVGRAVLVTALLLLIFGSLFASADAAFAHLLRGVRVQAVGGRAVVSFLVIAVLAASTGYLSAGRPRLDELARRPDRRVRRLEWAIPLIALDALFLVFVLVQVAVLFGGRDHVLRTESLTYAEYTHSGFWQLVVVTLLTLVVLGVTARLAPRREPADRALLRLLLGALSVLTLVIVASALSRLYAYEQAYGFTRLRVLVGATELWLGLLFLLVLAAGIRLDGGWLPRAVAGTAVAGLLLVALANPDGFVADRNVDRYQATGRIDLEYASRLSPDAVPALERLPARQRSCALADIAGALESTRDGWRAWNASRQRARALIAVGSRPTIEDCWQ